jgi:hypothetical protein
MNTLPKSALALKSSPTADGIERRTKTVLTSISMVLFLYPYKYYTSSGLPKTDVNIKIIIRVIYHSQDNFLLEVTFRITHGSISSFFSI